METQHVHSLHQRLQPLRPQPLPCPLLLLLPLLLLPLLLQPSVKPEAETHHLEKDDAIPTLQPATFAPKLVFKALHQPFKASLPHEASHPPIQHSQPCHCHGVGHGRRGEGGREGGRVAVAAAAAAAAAWGVASASLSTGLREGGKRIFEGVRQEAGRTAVQAWGEGGREGGRKERSDERAVGR